MKEKLFSLLGIEQGEGSMIITLLTQSVFLGIFLGSFDISAHSLFLSVFDEKMMARGYVLSGLAGIILTSAYTFLQTRVLFRNFSIANLGFVTCLTLLLWVLLLIMPAHWVVFLVFIMLGPLNILAMLGFWGTVSRLFTLRQGKRLFSLVDAGLVVGGIVSCYAIPVLLTLNFKSHNILLISASAIFIATLIQGIIGSRFLSVRLKENEQPVKKVKKKSVLSIFRENHYIRTLGIFIALSVMSAFFVMYSFMAVTREQYPAEQDMARFLGLFTGSMMIFTLLMKLTVFAYLVRNYGLKTCLAMSPVLITFFTIIAVVLGSWLGYTPGPSSFLLFFMILALSRLFSKSLKDSIESPSFKIVYLTIDEKSRYEVQSGMDGTVNEIAALSSGILLAGLGMISFIKLIHFSVVLVFIAGLWIFFAFRVYSEYRKSIKEALAAGGHNDTGSGLGDTGNEDAGSVFAGMALHENYYSLVTGDMTSLDIFKGGWFREKILNHSESTLDVAMIPVVRKIASGTEIYPALRDRASRISESLEHRLSSSSDKDERLSGLQKLLPDARQPQTTQILRLLRSNQSESKAIGLLLIGKYKMKDMIQEALECLDSPGLKVQAKNVIRSFGSGVNDNLQRFYMMSSGNTELSKSLLRIMAEEGSIDNRSFLFARLWTNSRRVREMTLRLLSGMDYKVSTGDSDRIMQLISDIIGILVWNLSARISLVKEHDETLLPTLNRETARWNNFLFSLLSITYDKVSISQIRENLESGTVESVNYALEMIDLVIDDSIKPKVILLLDAIPDENKVRNLNQFYPGEIPDHRKLVEDILNRDYNLLGIWIRACVLHNLPEIDSDQLGESVVALLFSPEAILREEAAGLVARSGNRTLESVSGRIDDKLNEQIGRFRNHSIEEGNLLFGKVRFLSETIKGIDEDFLLPLAAEMRLEKGTKDRTEVKDGFVLWPSQNEGWVYSLPIAAVEDFNFKDPDRAEPILRYIENI